MLALLLLPPPSAVLAADVETTIVLESVDSPVTIGQTAWYRAHMSPAPPRADVWFEVSYDGGTTFTRLASASVNEFGEADGGHYEDWPEGTRLVRATYSGTTGFAPSVSNTLTQVVTRIPTAVQRFSILGPGRQTQILPGSSPVTLQADVTGATQWTTAPVVFEEYLGSAWVQLGSSDLLWSGGAGFAKLQLDGLSSGTHKVRAKFLGDEHFAPSSSTKSVTVARDSLNLIVTGSTEVQANHSLPIGVGISGSVSYIDVTGTIALKEGSVVKATATAPHLSVTLPPMSVGTHTFVASYSGDGNYLPATSAPFVVTVVPDIVDASGVGVQYTPFYPYVDGYRDTTAIKGTRLEPISVSIKIYNSTGTLVRAASVARGTGAYSYAWNGRTSGGTLLPSGSYKVVQTLTDAFGTTKVVTTGVWLSHKRLVTYTAYVTKKGSALSAKGAGGTGSSATVSTTSGYAKLTAGSMGWALGGWEFALPSATTYKSIAFRVYAKSGLSAPPTSIAMQNFANCPRVSGDWYDTCFDRWTGIGNATGALAWYSTSGSVSANRSDIYVRGLVRVRYKTTYIYKAEVKVVYTVLK